MKHSREWLAPLVISLLVTMVTVIPYALGYALSTPDKQFTGVIMNPEDSQSYFAKMLQGYDGNWLYTIPFTTEEHAPAFIGGFYLALGQLARVCGISITTMWHVARVVASTFLFLTIFGFIGAFVRDSRVRWTAYLLAIFGSGLGCALFILNQPYWLDNFPVDFKMPEAHPFFTALTFPHISTSTALLLISVWLMNRAMNPVFNLRARWIAAIGAGLANLGIAITFPFLIYLGVAIAGLYWVCLTICAHRLLILETFLFATMFIMPAPPVLYYGYTLATNPVFRAWDAQAITLSPPVPHYLIAYGVMLLLAILPLLKRRQLGPNAILWIFVFASAILVYAPHPQQRRFVQGVHVPLAILATIGLFDVVFPWLEKTRAFKWLASRPRYSVPGLERLLIVLFLLVMALSNLYVLTSVTVTTSVQQPYPLFRSLDEMNAVAWLRANTPRSGVVLSAYETGNYIGAHGGNRVVIGHWTETVNWEEKMNQVASFYSTSSNDAERQTFLLRYRVQYVFFGPHERGLGVFDPSQKKYLRLVYSNNQSQVFAVLPEQLR